MTTLGQFILRSNKDWYKLSRWEIVKMRLSGAMEESCDAKCCANCDHFELPKTCKRDEAAKLRKLPFESCDYYACVIRSP